MIVNVVVGLMLAAGVPHETYVLRTDASVWDVAVEDLTGDGRAEILLVCCDAETRPFVKFVALYPAGAGGEYASEAAVRLDLDPSISTLFFAEVDGAPPRELVAADAAGATVFRYEDGRFAVLATPRFRSLLPSGSKEPAFLKDIASDLDDDGIDEWIVPAPAGYDVRTAEALVCGVECDVVSEIFRHGSVYITHRLPAYRTFEIEGEPKMGLAFLSDEVADFAYGPGWSLHERFEVPVNVDEKWEASAKMEDLNDDAFPDLIVTQTKGTVNLKAVTHVYLAAAPFTYPEAPTAVFEADGAIASPAVLDVDGNGTRDMVLVKIPFGIRNVINFFLRRKVAIRVDVYLLNDDRFEPKPTYTEKVLLDAPEGRERVAYTFGDFSGDGRIDVAYGAASDRLEIHTSSPERLVSPKPWVALAIPTFGVARPCDLNGNDNKDLVLFHPSGEHNTRVEVVVF